MSVDVFQCVINLCFFLQQKRGSAECEGLIKGVRVEYSGARECLLEMCMFC